ncbi:minor capsid protein [Hyalangium versicolor]|uniref:minor capsid protein n=1 Tax=Hyalangium versicolor TaxID=2861190 RepID=UPI001CCEA35E|nr:minor capsid protein [Hyalangium versicolor]
MPLRDVELDVATLLEAAGLGSMSSNPPTLYAGPFPASAPEILISCLSSGGETPEDYLAGTSRAYFRPEVTVRVRGPREKYRATLQRALDAWEALYGVQTPEYVLVKAQGAGPAYLGPDENGRHRFSFTVQLAYTALVVPRMVVS